MAKAQHGTVVAVCTSPRKGTPKTEVAAVELVENHGLAHDAHAGTWHRQVSLLSYEKVEAFRQKGGQVQNGSFGENVLVSGLDLAQLPIGTRLACKQALLEVTQIGKECHARCAIYESVGDCIMPREGIFARVLRGGRIAKGDVLYVEDPIPGGGADGQ